MKIRFRGTNMRVRAVCGLAFFVLCCVCALGQNVLSRPAGYVRIAVEPMSQMLVSTPFAAGDNRLDAVMAGQLTGGPVEDRADAILWWEPATCVYAQAVKAAGTGDTGKDGKWFADFVSWKETETPIRPGEGFFICNRQTATQTVYLCGEVPLEESREGTFYPAANLFGYPYASAVGIAQSGLDETMGPLDGVIDGNGDEALEFRPGKGYWYLRNDTTALVWKVRRPYASPFPTNNEPPAIERIGPACDGTGVELVIRTAGCAGEEVAVLYQDVGETNRFDVVRRWRVAEKAVAPGGRKSLVWTDRGARDRSPPHETRMRCYLLVRTDTGRNCDDVAGEVGFGEAASAASALRNRIGTGAGNTAASGGSEGDGTEVSISATARTRGVTGAFYVDAVLGDDAYSGLAAAVGGGHGPKRTINAAMTAAGKGDTVYVAGGEYRESVHNGKVRLIATGRVIVRGL